MIRFTLKFTTALVLVYLVVGNLFFNFVSKEYYQGSQPVFSKFLISPSDSLHWSEVLIWMIPVQIIRGLLIGCVLYSLKPLLDSKNYIHKSWILFSHYFVLSGLAAISPSVGNLEGMLFLQNFISWKIHLTILSEILIQSLSVALIFSWWIQPNLNQST